MTTITINGRDVVAEKPEIFIRGKRVIVDGADVTPEGSGDLVINADSVTIWIDPEAQDA